MDTSLYTWQTPQGNLSIVPEGQGYGLFLSTGKEDIRIADGAIRFEGPVFTDLAGKVAEFFMGYFPMVTENASIFSVVFYEMSILDEEPAEILKGFEFEANALEKKVLLPFSSKAPAYRRVIPGLNLEGICNFQGCLAEGKEVYIPIGMGKHQFAQLTDHVSCPACKKPIPADVIKNLGFWKCTYTLDGKQTAPVEKKVDETEMAIDKMFTTFETGDNVTWRYLDITTESTIPAAAPPVQPPVPTASPSKAKRSSSGCTLF